MQLERLQEKTADIEEMSSGISFMVLGLNEFRLNLPGCMDTKPCGLYAVAGCGGPARWGPFCRTCVGSEGSIVCGCQPHGKLLDDFELICFLAVRRPEGEEV